MEPRPNSNSDLLNSKKLLLKSMLTQLIQPQLLELTNSLITQMLNGKKCWDIDQKRKLHPTLESSMPQLPQLQ
jgi:hypothetical protein